MSDPYGLFFAIFLGAWNGALVLGILALRLAMARHGREGAWPFVRHFAPLLDLFGTWAGTLSVLALAFGRIGFTLSWAAALTLVCLMVTASLYDRAVLMPSLEAAWRRADHDPKWEDDWRFLWKMAGWGRTGMLGLGMAALVVGLLA